MKEKSTPSESTIKKPAPIPITVVAGFLGTGKATLLNQILQGEHGRKIAVLVNDFGSINIDAELITELPDRLEHIAIEKPQRRLVFQLVGRLTVTRGRLSRSADRYWTKWRFWLRLKATNPEILYASLACITNHSTSSVGTCVSPCSREYIRTR